MQTCRPSNSIRCSVVGQVVGEWFSFSFSFHFSLFFASFLFTDSLVCRQIRTSWILILSLPLSQFSWIETVSASGKKWRTKSVSQLDAVPSQSCSFIRLSFLSFLTLMLRVFCQSSLLSGSLSFSWWWTGALSVRKRDERKEKKKATRSQRRERCCGIPFSLCSLPFTVLRTVSLSLSSLVSLFVVWIRDADRQKGEEEKIWAEEERENSM